MANFSDVIEQAGRQFNVDPKLLSLVMGQESGGNAGAVSPKGARGPMQVMPDTAKDMGVTDPRDPVQNIMAGAKYLAQQLDKYKDVPTALAAYNAGPGAVDKHGGIPPFPETQGYVKSIIGAYQGNQSPAVQATPTSQSLPGMPPVSAHMPGLPPTAASPVENEPGQSTATNQLPGLPPTAANSASVSGDDPFAKLAAKAGGLPAASKAGPGQPQTDPYAQLVAKAEAATSAGAKPTPLQAMQSKLSVADLPGAAVEPILTVATGMLGGISGGANRLFSAATGHSYEEAKATGDSIANRLTYSPRTDGGKASVAGLGDLASKAGNALMTSPAGPALSAVGHAYKDTFVKGATNPLMATVNDMIPGLAAGVVAGKAGSAALDVAKAAPDIIRATPGAVRAGIDKAATVVGRGKPAIPNIDPPQAPSMAGVGAAAADLNPFPPLSGEEAARGGSSTFPQVKLSKVSGSVPAAEQATRAQIANEILGGDTESVRPGVISGNEDILRSEYTHAKSSENTPAQLLLRQQIAKEQQALSEYAQARVEATGANPNFINNEQRGLAINDAFHGEGGLADYFEQAKQQIYDRAKAESGSNPIQTKHVDTLLNDPQFLAEAKRNGHTGVVDGARDLIDLARQTGFKDPITGEIHAPGSVGAWDAVRKSNNAGWSPDNARTIRAINQAIDQDVAGAAGSDAYKLGDAIHRTEKTVMEPSFMKSMFGGMDANGVKKGVALEALPGKLNNIPIDQWKHVYNTLDDLSRGQVHGAPEGMPPVSRELRQMAEAARNEMSGALARAVHEKGAGRAGVWNQNDANKVLNSTIGQKIVQTFPPDEVARFHALNYGGQIMPGVHSYEGARAQEIRMSKPTFMETKAEKVGAGVGGAVGGTLGGVFSGGVGGVAGTNAGANLGKWVGSKLAGRSTVGRLREESNALERTMRNNSRLAQKAPRNALTDALGTK